MNNLIKIIVGSFVVLSLASCSTQNPNGNNGDTRVYKAKDGTVYRQGEVYKDRNGNIYQNGRIIKSSEIFRVPNAQDNDGRYKKNKRNKLPPGQAKKIYGGDAKDYAPGQQNKKYKKQKVYKEDASYKSYKKAVKKQNKKKNKDK